MRSWAGVNVGKPITNIINLNKLVSFVFMDAHFHTITATCNENGSIDPKGASIVVEGGSLTYSITPNERYSIETVLINGENDPTAVSTGTYTFTEVNSDQTIHATFTPTTYKVTFNPNGGEGDMEPQIFDYDIEQKLTKNSFIKTGFKFKNWNTQVEGSGTSYEDEEEISITSSITLFAQWVNSDATLSNLAISEGELTPEFSSTNYNYEASVEFDLLIVTITATVSDENATVTGDTGEKSLDVGENTFIITVTAEDGETTQDYTIVITRANDVNILDVITESGVTVYPNPTRGELIIDNGQLTIDNVEVYDISGRLVGTYPCGRPNSAKGLKREGANAESSIVINVSSLPKGVYMIKLIENKHISTQKFVVE
jgi:hypothetical protein